MIATATFVFVLITTIIVGMGIGFVIAWRFKAKTSASSDPHYEALYEEAKKRLVESMEESQSINTLAAGLNESISWHRSFVEHLIKEFNINDEDLHKVIKKVNDSKGIVTPSLDEMNENVEKVMRAFGIKEEDIEKMKEIHPPDENPKNKYIEPLTLDSVLDKLSKDGEESLTPEELEFLKNPPE